MRKIIISLAIVLGISFSNCNAGNTGKPVGANDAATSKVIAMTNDMFKQKVFNYEVNKDWKFEGKLPVIIDFYADWCGPCKQLSPRLEEIAKEYDGKIIVYKVNTDKERELSQNLGIQSLPTLLFIPVKGKPQASMGALPKETLVKAVNEVLLVK